MKSGVLRFYGRTHFQEGIWCGVELDGREGRHGGQVQGVRYFDCEEDRGVFAPLYKVTLLSEDEEEEGEEEEEEVAPRVGLKRENTFTIDDEGEDVSERNFSASGGSVDMERNKRPRRPPQAAAAASAAASKGSTRKAQPKRRSCMPAASKVDETFTVKEVEEEEKSSLNRTFDLGRAKSTVAPAPAPARRWRGGGGRRMKNEVDSSMEILSPTHMLR